MKVSEKLQYACMLQLIVILIFQKGTVFFWPGLWALLLQGYSVWHGKTIVSGGRSGTLWGCYGGSLIYPVKVAVLGLVLLLTGLRFSYSGPGIDLVQATLAYTLLPMIAGGPGFLNIQVTSLHLMTLLGFNFISSESFLYSLIVLAANFSVLIILFLSHQPVNSPDTLRENLRNIFRTFVKTTPFILLLFLILPGIAGYLTRDESDIIPLTGFGERLDPGSVAALTSSDSIALTVTPSPGVLPSSGLYWRGQVLTRSSGLQWSGVDKSRGASPELYSGAKTTWSIQKEPGTGSWVMTPGPLLRVILPGGKELIPDVDGTLSLGKRLSAQSYQAIVKSQSLFSAWDQAHSGHLQEGEKATGEIRELIQRLKALHKNPLAFSEGLLSWFSSQGFLYSLKPGRILPPTVAEFLKVRKGFCGHYAAAFASILRFSGIPSRVVVGFHGGEVNPVTGKLIVRNSDAHSWVEARFPGDPGWTRIDPTEAVAPDRIRMGGQKYHLFDQLFLGAFSFDSPREIIWFVYSWLTALAELVQSGFLYLLKFSEFLPAFNARTVGGILTLTFLLLVALRLYRFSGTSFFLEKILSRFYRIKKIPGLPHETELEYLVRLKDSSRMYSEHDGNFVHYFLTLRYSGTPVTSRDRRRLKNLLKKTKIRKSE